MIFDLFSEMSRKILATFLFFIPLINIGQDSIESRKLDTINYNQHTKYYVLDLVATDQLIYFDSIIYDNSQPVTILIRNNTRAPVFIYVKSLMSAIHIFLENSTRYIQPSECYSISLRFYPSQYRFENFMPLQDLFYFTYFTNDSIKNFAFGMRGYVKLDTLSKIEFEEHPDLIVSSSSIPESVLRHQDSLRGILWNKFSNFQEIKPYHDSSQVIERPEYSNTPPANLPQYKFRKELWVYPKLESNTLPENLTLKFFINDSPYFAKKRIDSLNHIYFKIPLEMADSAYGVLSSPEYGFIAKKMFVREQANEVEISFQLGAKLNEPHYYNSFGLRKAIPAKWIDYFFVERGIEDSKLMMMNFQGHIDSLNSLIKEFNAQINYGLDGYILNCKPELVAQIKERLGNLNVYQMIDDRSWISNAYVITFESNLSKETISEIIQEYGITEFNVYPSEDSEKKLIKQIDINLKNLPGSRSNNLIINELMKRKEILKIAQWSYHFPTLD